MQKQRGIVAIERPCSNHGNVLQCAVSLGGIDGTLNGTHDEWTETANNSSVQCWGCLDQILANSSNLREKASGAVGLMDRINVHYLHECTFEVFIKAFSRERKRSKKCAVDMTCVKGTLCFGQEGGGMRRKIMCKVRGRRMCCKRFAISYLSSFARLF